MTRAVATVAVAFAFVASAVAANGDDGRYAGKLSRGGTKITLRVSEGGRSLTNLKTTVPVLCIVGESDYIHAIEDEYPVSVPGAPIAANGRFSKTHKVNRETTITIRGRLAHQRITDGYLHYEVRGDCKSMTVRWSARRVGR